LNSHKTVRNSTRG